MRSSWGTAMGDFVICLSSPARIHHWDAHCDRAALCEPGRVAAESLFPKEAAQLEAQNGTGEVHSPDDQRVQHEGTQNVEESTSLFFSCSQAAEGPDWVTAVQAEMVRYWSEHSME